ncbi:MAG: hypothetical protein QOD74_1610 [Variibacter sp.]|jgi:Flp pilus assembly protein TadG|nr:hypothetical protein [Variibacter sp.]
MRHAVQRIHMTLAQMRARIAGLTADERGVSAVEFAMLLPLMITLYLGGVELSQAISIDRKVSLVSRSVADLVAQSTTISNSEMTNILNAAAAVAAPYAKMNLKVTVSSVTIDAQGNAKVVWSDALNTVARPTNQTVTIPTSLKIANTTLIWGEVQYAYKPAIGYLITGTMNLTDQIYMRPRQSETVARTS